MRIRTVLCILFNREFRRFRFETIAGNSGTLSSMSSSAWLQVALIYTYRKVNTNILRWFVISCLFISRTFRWLSFQTCVSWNRYDKISWPLHSVYSSYHINDTIWCSYFRPHGKSYMAWTDVCFTCGLLPPLLTPIQRWWEFIKIIVGLNNDEADQFLGCIYFMWAVSTTSQDPFM